MVQERLNAERRKQSAEQWRGQLSEFFKNPGNFGDHTASFANQEAVDGYMRKISEIAQNGMSPRDVYSLHMMEKILNDHGEAATRRHLEKQKASNGNGAGDTGNVNQNVGERKASGNAEGNPNSVFDFLKRDNPDLVAKLMQRNQDFNGVF